MALTEVDAARLNDNVFNTVGPFKNRVINGDMRIDQRNAGAAVTSSIDPTYVVDRWAITHSQSSKFTIQQNAGSVTRPAGFTNYLGATVAASVSVSASDYFALYQPIEGFNVADLNYGSASAATVTLSFWVRSSLTGTFGGAIRNPTGNRSYPFTYTVSAANTWEQKTITIAGDTSAATDTTNGQGLAVRFGLGAGSTFSGTAGSWATGNFMSATGATSVVGTNGATFYITGVQLEAGSVATPFERRSYGQELMLCQRYYEKSYNQSVVPGTATDVGMWCAVGSNSASCGGLTWKAPKRAAPTVTLYSYDGTAGAVDKLASGTKVTGATATDIGENSFRYVAVTTTVESHKYQYTLNAEL